LTVLQTSTKGALLVSYQYGILFIGDIVGRVGLETLLDTMPALKERYKPQFIITNGENIVNGKGMTDVEADILFKAGATVITTGNHIWEQWKARPMLAERKNILRPHNYPKGNPGTGYCIAECGDGKRIGVLQLQGRTYMSPIDCPFRTAEQILPKLKLETNIIIVDFHADATAEKIAMGWFLDGQVSAVLGTHTHVQTGDARLLPKGTAYISDVGMTGPYDSVIGMKTDIAIKRMLLQTAHKYEVAEHDVRVCGAFVKVDARTGKATHIENFTLPEWKRSE
jgi:2',3'-cyclic-nucleotide 2'-phosphodiesterase